MADWLEPRPAGAPVGIVCGTMNFGKRTPEEEAHRIVARSLERGVNLFDNLDLEPLAETAGRLKRWEFLFMAGPTPVQRGTGSPINPIAVF